ncbi:hypothetical protein ABDK56_10195 [Sphingomonas sp. ASV193]|uniref:hypothetical protein n=1 Tax=Sphingomonas sp. ASV193 TaxID=3144405 RepID=UPI0032E91158
MRIGFLFNHDQIHQVAHSLPVAKALKAADPALEVIVATTNDRLAAEVERLSGLIGGPALEAVSLRPRERFGSGMLRALNRLAPVAKLALYRDHLDWFAGLDALVVTEKTSTILRTRYGLDRVRLIHTRHGAGDRAVGFDPASALFDLVLVSGPKIRDRLLAETSLTPDRLAMVGYPKFDLPATGGLPAKLAANGRPTVLYNPHVSPHLSSWYRDGRAILDWFAANPQWNLIFAPHVMLFERRVAASIDRFSLAFPGSVERRIVDAPNIHVDLGSPASTDMRYTRAADLYLGDVSSQLYEFIRTPRPAIFVNSHGIDWAGDANYRHWTAGEVIGGADALAGALARAAAEPPRYEAAQRALFAESIDLTDTPSSIRAAGAIRAFLDRSA